MSRRSRKCPICGETGIPIVYGMPTYEVFEIAQTGVLKLGGCDLIGDDPTWWCERDQYGWDGPDPSRAIRETTSTEPCQ